MRISSRTYSLLVPQPRFVTCSSTNALSLSGSEIFIVAISNSYWILAKIGKIETMPSDQKPRPETDWIFDVFQERRRADWSWFMARKVALTPVSIDALQ